MAGTFGSGPWKEGRAGAASLFYADPAPADLAWVAANHAAVYIRASVAGADSTWSEALAARKWDLHPAGTCPARIPLRDAGSDALALRALIDAVVGRGKWAVWRFTAADLRRMGPDAHASLLQWLGEHHGRVWCAPLRDIGDYAQANGLI
jgi:hypothetical protein